MTDLATGVVTFDIQGEKKHWANLYFEHRELASNVAWLACGRIEYKMVIGANGKLYYFSIANLGDEKPFYDYVSS
jgi:hypothetical protein